MLSLITTCKNRLQYLKQTLPLMLKQSMAEVIVVDYGCEQGTADWVKEHHPAAKVVQVNDDPIFCLARARNMGARNSSHNFFCFVDSDVMIHEQLGEWLWIHKDPKKFYLYPMQNANENELTGFSIVAKDHFLKTGGFDEAFKGWGGEDNDFYERLKRIGLSEAFIPQNSISAVSHDSTVRQLREGSGGYETVSEALSMNHLYRLIKRDIWQITNSDIDLENRKQLFQHIFLKTKKQSYKSKISSKWQSTSR